MTTWKDKMAAATAKKEAADREAEALQARVREACAVRDAAEARAKTADEQIRAARDEALVSILTPEVVDILAPEHGRRSCSDQDTRNDYDGCARCALLGALTTKTMPGSAWRFTVDEVRR